MQRFVTTVAVIFLFIHHRLSELLQGNITVQMPRLENQKRGSLDKVLRFVASQTLEDGTMFRPGWFSQAGILKLFLPAK